MSHEEQLINAVTNERERIKAIIRKHEEVIIDEVTRELGPAGDSPERKAFFAATRAFIEVFTDIESAIDGHNLSRLKISAEVKLS